MIAMYPTIRDILVALGEDTSQRGEWTKIRTMVGVLESFDLFLVLILCLRFLDTQMNYSSVCKEETNIFHAMLPVGFAKSKCSK